MEGGESVKESRDIDELSYLERTVSKYLGPFLDGWRGEGGGEREVRLKKTYLRVGTNKYGHMRISY